MAIALLLLSELRSQPVTRFALTEGTFVCGRSSECDFVLFHRSVSRQHAEIEVTEMRIAVRDLDSRNGTFLNGSRVDSATLTVGHVLRLGKISLLVAGEPPALSEIESGLETTSGRDLVFPDVTNFGVPDLSAAERRVVDLVLEGLAEKQIARQLGISQHTVHNHLREIYRIFDVHTRSELLVRLLGRSQGDETTRDLGPRPPGDG
jgi:DNA-binding CsgD family transcriptional regulator